MNPHKKHCFFVMDWRETKTWLTCKIRWPDGMYIYIFFHLCQNCLHGWQPCQHNWAPNLMNSITPNQTSKFWFHLRFPSFEDNLEGHLLVLVTEMQGIRLNNNISTFEWWHFHMVRWNCMSYIGDSPVNRQLRRIFLRKDNRDGWIIQVPSGNQSAPASPCWGFDLKCNSEKLRNLL